MSDRETVRREILATYGLTDAPWLRPSPWNGPPEPPEHRACRQRTNEEQAAIAALLWCEFCQHLVQPEWRRVAGYEVAMHRHGDAWHGCHRAEVNPWGDGGTVVDVYEVVVRENGQFKTLEPGEIT